MKRNSSPIAARIRGYCSRITVVPFIVALTGFLFCWQPAKAQNAGRYLISGTVTDSATSTPLEGVTVNIRGEKTNTLTNKDGHFELQSLKKQVTLVFSYVGYINATASVNDAQPASIRMTQSATNLNQVIVVGYGTQKKATITGSVAAITGDELVTTKNENIINSMAGKVPGFRVVQKSSEPGSFNTSFDIRGLGNPLIVIDGVPRDNITRLDPYEIESISIVKDATAAVYGVRAANGVILITTRNGKKGKAEITYSGSYGVQKYLGFPQTVDAVDFMKLTNEHVGHNVDAPGTVRYSDVEIADYANGTKKSTDWFAPTIKKYTPQYENNISASGGSDKVTYFFSVGNLYQNGIWKTNDLNYKKYNFRSNISAKVSERLTAEMRIAGITDTKNAPDADAWGIIRGLWREKPIDPIYANDNPAYPYKSTDVANPLVVTNSALSGYKVNTNNWVQGSVSLTYDVPAIDGLKAKGLYSYDYNNLDNKEYRKAYMVYTYDPTNGYTGTSANTPTGVQRNFGKNTQSLMQLSLTYNHSFKAKHNVSLLALYEESDRRSDNFYAYREGGLVDALDQLFSGGSLNQVGAMDVNGLTHYTNKGLVGMVDYNYKLKYIAGFRFRYDGSSKFAPGSQWGFFPVITGGWRISEENFFKNSKALSFITNLKIRGSYGKTGDDGSSSYQFITGYNYPSGGSAFNGYWVNGLSSRGTPNPNLTWFTSKTLDVGFDADFWNGLLGVTFSAFDRNRDGLLATRILTLPGTAGTNLPQENLNGDHTSGVELLLTHKSRIGDVNINLSGNIAYSRTRWKYVERAKAGNSYDNWLNNLNNRYNDIQWGMGYTGQVQNYNQIYNSNINYGGGNRGLLPGDFLYQDWNGDGIIDGNDIHPLAGSKLPNINDVTTNVSPQITYGFTIGAEYKGIDLNILLQGTGRFNVQYIEALKEPGALDGNILSQFLDRWHPATPTADPYDPHTQWVPGYYAYTGTVAADNTERSIQNAAYLRIKTVELGYTLPRQWMKKAGLTSARFYVNCYNLATFTGLKFLDPEHPADLYGYLYPLNKTYNVGLNLTF